MTSLCVAEVVSVSSVEDGAVITGEFAVTDLDNADTHSFTVLDQPTEGSVINNDDGTFSFNPGNDFQDLAEGETREVTFTYAVADDSGADNDTSEAQTVTITVTGTNDQPEAEVVNITAHDGGNAVTADFSVTDDDSSDTHTFTILTQPAEGAVINNDNGTFSFDPGSDFEDLAEGETREVTFSYTVEDSSGAANGTSDAQTVTITVTGSNNQPVAEVVSVSGTEDGDAVTGQFQVADLDLTDSHSFNILTQPVEGSVTNNNDGSFSFNPGNDFQNLSAGETREVTFTYEAVDGSGTDNAASAAYSGQVEHLFCFA